MSAFKFNFHSWLQITTEFTTDWTAASASSFLIAAVRIETSSAKRAIEVEHAKWPNRSCKTRRVKGQEQNLEVDPE